MIPRIKKVKDILENLTGYDVYRYGNQSFALTNRNQMENAWFVYNLQLESVFKRLRINLVLDVGANEGQFAKELRSFYDGEILSFEPVSSVFNELTRNASSDPKWHVYKIALGSQESFQAINVSNTTVFSSLLQANEYCAKHFGQNALGTSEETVTVRRLDKLLDEIASDLERKRIFVKMDTQGYDNEVFKGLGNKLKHVIAIQSEISLMPLYHGMPHWTSSISLYENNGFEVVGMFPVQRDSLRVIEYDCLMIKKESS